MVSRALERIPLPLLVAACAFVLSCSEPPETEAFDSGTGAEPDASPSSPFDPYLSRELDWERFENCDCYRYRPFEYQDEWSQGECQYRWYGGCLFGDAHGEGVVEVLF